MRKVIQVGQQAWWAIGCFGVLVLVAIISFMLLAFGMTEVSREAKAYYAARMQLLSHVGEPATATLATVQKLGCPTNDSIDKIKKSHQ